MLVARACLRPPRYWNPGGSMCICMAVRYSNWPCAACRKTALQAIAAAELTPDEIALVIPHQSNLRIIEAITKRLELPSERVFTNLDRYGNTSAASIPIALAEAAEQGRIHDGDNILVTAFGGGLTWASAVVRWGGLAPA